MLWIQGMPARKAPDAEHAAMRDVNARMRPKGVEDLDPEDPSQVLNDVSEPPDEPDKELPEDFEGEEEGENFLESLARHATEDGPRGK